MNLANKLTVARILLIPLIILFYLINYKYIAATIFIIAALTDILDGYLARKSKTITVFGKFFDPIADKILLLTALALLTEHKVISSVVVIIILSREFIVSGLRLVAVADGKVISASWLAKVKTVSQDIALSLLMLDNYPFRYINVPLDKITLYIALGFTIWSGVDYIVKNKEVLKKINSNL